MVIFHEFLFSHIYEILNRLNDCFGREENLNLLLIGKSSERDWKTTSSLKI